VSTDLQVHGVAPLHGESRVNDSRISPRPLG